MGAPNPEAAEMTVAAAFSAEKPCTASSLNILCPMVLTNLPSAYGRAKRHGQRASHLDPVRHGQVWDVVPREECQGDNTHGFLSIVGSVACTMNADDTICNLRNALLTRAGWELREYPRERQHQEIASQNPANGREHQGQQNFPRRWT